MITKQQLIDNRNIMLVDKAARKWKLNGKLKTWKTRPNEFSQPIKHGLYQYGYVTHENAEHFEIV